MKFCDKLKTISRKYTKYFMLVLIEVSSDNLFRCASWLILSFRCASWSILSLNISLSHRIHYQWVSPSMLLALPVSLSDKFGEFCVKTMNRTSLALNSFDEEAVLNYKPQKHKQKHSKNRQILPNEQPFRFHTSTIQYLWAAHA